MEQMETLYARYEGRDEIEPPGCSLILLPGRKVCHLKPFDFLDHDEMKIAVLWLENIVR